MTEVYVAETYVTVFAYQLVKLALMEELPQTPRMSETYDVHLRRDGQWMVETMGLTPVRARELAEEGFRKPGVDGMRIVRCRESTLTGVIDEEIVAEKSRNIPSPEAAVGEIEDAPYCHQVEDLFELPARLCLFRLFQGWLASHEVGVIECLLTPRLTEQVMDRGSLVPTATHRVAALQTIEGENPDKRRNELLSLIDQVRRLAFGKLEKLQKLGAVQKPEQLLSVLEACKEDRVLALTAIASYLGEFENRLAKVAALSDLLAEGPSPIAAAMVDEVLADYLFDEIIALELAGPAAFRIDRLEWIAAAATGTLEEQGLHESPHDFSSIITSRISHGFMPRSRQALLLALDCLLRDTSDLDDGTSGREQKALLRLTSRLGRSDSFAGGPRLASRLTQRFSQFEKQEGNLRFVEAAETITLDMNNIDLQLRYLFALMSGSTLSKVQRGLLAIIDNALRLYGGLQRLARTEAVSTAFIYRIDGLCVLIESATLGPKTRATWLKSVSDCLLDVVTANDWKLENAARLVERAHIRSAHLQTVLWDGQSADED